jgi:hypothetical protein
MKRFLPLLLILLLLPMDLWAATYYLRADGAVAAADKANATSCAAAASAMNITQHNAATFAVGDTITLCDTGGVFRDAILTPPTTGTIGAGIITYNASGTPVVSGFDVTTSWTQYSSGTGTGVGNLVSDDFEDNDLVGWSTQPTPTVSATTPIAGTYSLLMNAQEWVYRTVTASGEIWVQAKVRFDTIPASTNAFLQIYSGATRNGSVYYNNTNSKIEWYNDVGASSGSSTHTFTSGNVYLLEFRWRKSATVGQAQLWVDGVSEFSLTGQNNGANDADKVLIGSLERSTYVITFDDIKISDDAYIGSSSPTNFWYKAHTASDGGVVLENGVPMNFVTWNTDAATSFGGKTAPAATFDPTGNRVYVWCTANADPATKTMEVSVREHAVAVAAKNYITFSNITSQGAYLHGGHVTGASDNITFNDCIFRWNGGQWNGSTYLGNGFEVNGGATNLTINHGSAYQNFDAGYSVQMLNTNPALSDITIDGVTAYQNRMTGVEILAGSGDGTMTNVTVKNSTLRNNDGTGWAGTHVNESGIYVDSYIAANMSNIAIQYNLIYGNGLRGIYTLLNAAGAVPVFAYNNTIYNNGIGVVNTATLTLKNNIVAQNASGEINTTTTITSDYNDFYHSAGGAFMTYDSATHTFAQWQAHSQDAAGISVDPLFVSTTDFRLRAGSPAINAGVNVGLTSDYSGKSIIGLPDLGAYEYSGGSFGPQEGQNWWWNLMFH